MPEERIHTTEFTNMRSLLTGLAKTMNLIDPEVEHHHEQTAYIASFIGWETGLSRDDVTLVIYAALLHDIGAIAYSEHRSLPEIESVAKDISINGANMLRDLPEMRDIAEIIAHCQLTWEETVGHTKQRCSCCEGIDREYHIHMSELASIIFLADRISVRIHPNQRILNQVKDICEWAKQGAGTMFNPKAVEAFLVVSRNEFFWLDIVKNPSFLYYFMGDVRKVSLKETLVLTSLMSRIVDFRSSFTAMHSAGVSASARALAELSGMSAAECDMMEIAGHLHDLGKLVVPTGILEKPGRLTDEEFNIIKEHPYYTRMILMDIPGFEKIADWAGYHHEKLNGRGYPFHFGEDRLDQGARILAVADIFSAITEERPYRKGMDKDKAIGVLRENVQNEAICKDIAELLFDHYEQVDAVRDRMSRERGKRYFETRGDAK